MPPHSEELLPGRLRAWLGAGNYFEHCGHRIFYLASGADDADITICLHGFPTSSFDYNKIWEALAANFTVAAHDMIGYGFSAKPRSFDYTTFAQADILEAFIAHLGAKRVHILSHDYGNTIMQELLARRSERGLAFKIASICFLNGALFPETHRPILAQKLLISPAGAVLGRFIPDRVFKKSLASIFGDATRPGESELAEYAELLNFHQGKLIAHKLIRYMTERARHRERWVAALLSIDVPFRFVNGLADPVSGRHLIERFREVVPDQRDIVELEGIGHFPHLEAPQVVSERYLDFRGR
jgi:pimeloyl-ACP methyl ester carboxylesterase